MTNLDQASNLAALERDLSGLAGNPSLVLAEAISRLGHSVAGTRVLFVQTEMKKGVVNLVTSSELSSSERSDLAYWLTCLLPYVPSATRAIELEVGRVPPSLIAGWVSYLSRNVLVKAIDLGPNRAKGLLLVAHNQPFTSDFQSWVNGVGDRLGLALQ